MPIAEFSGVVPHYGETEKLVIPFVFPVSYSF